MRTLLYYIYFDPAGNNIGSKGRHLVLTLLASNVVKELNTKNKEDLLCDVSNINDPVERVI